MLLLLVIDVGMVVIDGLDNWSAERALRAVQ
jgi:hypothetical protein